MKLGAVSAVPSVSHAGLSSARAFRPMVFAIGDGRPMVNVTVTIRDSTGNTVHTGFLERLSGRASYRWLAPAEGASNYFISWDGANASAPERGVLA